MINEDLYSSPRVKYVPVDLENTLIAREITTLIETISGAESI
jgi:hypothetical protein